MVGVVRELVLQVFYSVGRVSSHTIIHFLKKKKRKKKDGRRITQTDKRTDRQTDRHTDRGGNTSVIDT